MKPPKEYCKKYCDLYDTCERTECNRKPMWDWNKPIKMVEPIEYDKKHKSELIRAYKSSPLTKADMMTKYN